MNSTLNLHSSNPSLLYSHCSGCFNNAYQTLRTCPSGTVCSTDGGSTGCIWPFQQSSDANSVVTNAVVAATGGAQGAKGVNPTSLVTSWTADSTTTSTSTSTTSTWSPSSSISSSGSTPSAQVTSSTLSGVGQDLVHSKSHISSSYSSWTNSWWTPSASSTWAAASSAVTSSSSTSKWHANSAVTTTTTTTSAAAAVTGGGSGGSSGGSSGSGGSGTLLHTVIYRYVDGMIFSRPFDCLLRDPSQRLYSDNWLSVSILVAFASPSLSLCHGLDDMLTKHFDAGHASHFRPLRIQQVHPRFLDVRCRTCR